MQELNNQIITYEDEGDEISILDIMLIIAEGKKIILSFLFLFLLLGLSYGIFIQKPEYVSRLQIAPISQNSPKTGDFNIYADGNLISGILLSDSVLDSVIKKNSLLIKENGSLYSNAAARKMLKNSIDTKMEDKSGIITVEVKNKNPQKTLDIAKSLYEYTLDSMSEMGKTISNQKNSYILSEIEKNIEKINAYREQNSAVDTNKEIEELLRTLSLFSLYREKAPLVIQLVSAPELPDQPLPRGRGKTTLLSAFLGLFLGLTFVFLRYFWRVSSNDIESKEKIKKLKALLGLKNK